MELVVVVPTDKFEWGSMDTGGCKLLRKGISQGTVARIDIIC